MNLVAKKIYRSRSCYWSIQDNQGELARVGGMFGDKVFRHTDGLEDVMANARTMDADKAWFDKNEPEILRESEIEESIREWILRTF